jgi:predicted NUDIX family phosphoesterase
MSKLDKQILAVKTNILFPNTQPIGFIDINETNLLPVILENYEFKRRGDIEQDPSYQQPISYFLLIDKQDKTLFVYKRASDVSRYTDTRLFGVFSFGIGGHMDKEDTEQNDFDPITLSCKREIEEETGLTDVDMKIIGFINDDTNEVETVHLGVAGIAFIDKEKVIEAQEYVFCKFMNKKEIEEEVINNKDAVLEP